MLCLPPPTPHCVPQPPAGSSANPRGSRDLFQFSVPENWPPGADRSLGFILRLCLESTPRAWL